MGGSSSTTTNKTGELSALGKEYQSGLKDLILVNLQEQGYDIVPTDTIEYDNPQKADSLNQKVKSFDSRIADYDRQIADARSKGQKDWNLVDLRERVVQEKNLALNELAGLKQTKYTKYDIKRSPDPRLKQAIELYGENSKEAKEVDAAIKQERVDKAASIAEVEASYLKNLKKLASGDFSYTSEQANQVEKFIGPVKDLIISTSDKLLSKVGEDQELLRAELNNISAQIDQTGFDVADALEAASIQVDKSGMDLLDTLKQVNESTQAKYKFQQDLIFERIDQQVAQQTALLGLPPGSKAEIYQKAKMKNDALNLLTLQLNEDEMNKTLGIKQSINEEKKKIAFSYVALAESQGAKKEDIAKQAFNLLSSTVGKQEQIEGTTANALLSLEQNRQEMLQNAAFGMLPQMVAAGQGGIGFDLNQKVTQQNLNAGGMTPLSAQLGIEQQRTFAENTTTQTSDEGFLGALGSVVGMGASIGSAIATGGQSMAVSNFLGKQGQSSNSTVAQPSMYKFGNDFGSTFSLS